MTLWPVDFLFLLKKTNQTKINNNNNKKHNQNKQTKTPKTKPPKKQKTNLGQCIPEILSLVLNVYIKH